VGVAVSNFVDVSTLLSFCAQEAIVNVDFLSDELLLYDNGTSRPFAEDHHHQKRSTTTNFDGTSES